MGVISTGTAGFARMEGSSEVASSVLNNFHPLVVTLTSSPATCFTIELHSGDNKGVMLTLMIATKRRRGGL